MDNMKLAKVDNKKLAIEIRNKDDDTNCVCVTGFVNGPKYLTLNINIKIKLAKIKSGK
jgi:hypothetical protein